MFSLLYGCTPMAAAAPDAAQLFNVNRDQVFLLLLGLEICAPGLTSPWQVVGKHLSTSQSVTGGLAECGSLPHHALHCHVPRDDSLPDCRWLSTRPPSSLTTILSSSSGVSIDSRVQGCPLTPVRFAAIAPLATDYPCPLTPLSQPSATIAGCMFSIRRT